MKKSLIALAVAAALPVAAQAGTTLSGSIEVEYTLGSALAPAVDTALSIASTEVLANGMTATASMNVLSDADASGTVTLSGDFGSLTGGTSAATLADVANSSTDTNDEDADLLGVAYSGSFAGLSVHAKAGQFDADDTAGETPTDYSEYGASYDLNGLTLSGVTDTETDVGTAVETTTTTMAASYSFGDLTVSASKDQGKDAVVKAAYAATMGDLAVSASAESDNDWDLSVTYTMGDITITATDDEVAGGADISASYTSGALSLSVDSDSEVVVGYAMGNAGLTMTRDDAATTVAYKVSF